MMSANFKKKSRGIVQGETKKALNRKLSKKNIKSAQGQQAAIIKKRKAPARLRKPGIDGPQRTSSVQQQLRPSSSRPTSSGRNNVCKSISLNQIKRKPIKVQKRFESNKPTASCSQSNVKKVNEEVIVDGLLAVTEEEPELEGMVVVCDKGDSEEEFIRSVRSTYGRKVFNKERRKVSVPPVLESIFEEKEKWSTFQKFTCKKMRTDPEAVELIGDRQRRNGRRGARHLSSKMMVARRVSSEPTLIAIKEEP